VWRVYSTASFWCFSSSRYGCTSTCEERGRSAHWRVGHASGSTWHRHLCRLCVCSFWTPPWVWLSAIPTVISKSNHNVRFQHWISTAVQLFDTLIDFESDTQASTTLVANAMLVRPHSNMAMLVLTSFVQIYRLRIVWMLDSRYIIIFPLFMSVVLAGKSWIISMTLNEVSIIPLLLVACGVGAVRQITQSHTGGNMFDADERVWLSSVAALILLWVQLLSIVDVFSCLLISINLYCTGQESLLAWNLNYWTDLWTDSSHCMADSLY